VFPGRHAVCGIALSCLGSSVENPSLAPTQQPEDPENQGSDEETEDGDDGDETDAPQPSGSNTAVDGGASDRVSQTEETSSDRATYNPTDHEETIAPTATPETDDENEDEDDGDSDDVVTVEDEDDEGGYDDEKDQEYQV